jgi:hypothetical protein
VHSGDTEHGVDTVGFEQLNQVLAAGLGHLIPFMGGRWRNRLSCDVPYRQLLLLR